MTDLFADVINFENLHAAYLDARASKRYRSSILKFGYNLEENLLALRWELAHKTAAFEINRHFNYNKWHGSPRNDQENRAGFEKARRVIRRGFWFSRKREGAGR
jgi:hypothetical protein